MVRGDAESDGDQGSSGEDVGGVGLGEERTDIRRCTSQSIRGGEEMLSWVAIVVKLSKPGQRQLQGRDDRKVGKSRGVLRYGRGPNEADMKYKSNSSTAWLRM